MRFVLRVLAPFLLLAAQVALGAEAPKPPVAAIASAYPLASEAGFEILAAGGSAEPMDLFVAFRGREPSIEPLLRHNGIETNRAAAG